MKKTIPPITQALNIPEMIFRYGSFMLLLFLGMTTTDAVAQTVINNEKMRFGTGTENSVNTTGNLQQPFYYSTDFNAWRKLTFSNRSLNQTIGFGGDGTEEWNTNGVSFTDANLSNQTIDDSGFDYATGSTGPGTGTLVSTGQIAQSGNVFEIENIYTIGTSSFITIETKITNVGTQNITNLRYWIGTGDDYVGGTDSPTKERGNLVDGSFEVITAANEQAKALRIKTADEGVLFFSASDRAHNIVGSRYGWNYVLDRRPSDSPINITHDGSYGMYVRMNDLAPGESDEFTWYYAAAKLSELDGVVGEVAEAAGGLGNVTCNSAIYEAESTVQGTGYLLTVPNGSPAPTAAQIKAGVAYNGVTPVSALSQAMDSNVPYEFEITGLEPNTDYQAYFVLENTSAAFTDIVADDITTAGNPEITFDVIDANCVASADGELTASATNGTEPFAFQWTDGPATAQYGGLNAGPYDVHVTDANNCQATASATVGIDDVVAPVAVTKNIDVYLDADGQAALTADMIDDGSSDNCQLASMSTSVSTLDCADLAAPVSVTLTVTDADGNSDAANALVTVLDTVKPVVVAADIQVALDANGQATITANDVDAGSSDNCGIQTFALSKYDFNCQELGPNDVVLTVQDASGNTRSQTVVVTVTDDAAPVVQAQDVTVYLDQNASASIAVEDVWLTDSDNCGVVERTLDQTTFDCEDLAGPVSVNLSVKDAAGNVTQTAVAVTVADTIRPVAMPQDVVVFLNDDGEVTLTATQVAAWVGANSTDNCSIPQGNHGLSKMHFTCADLGENTVEYSVQDASGNIATAEVVLTVIDDTNPVARANDVTLDLDENGVAVLQIAEVESGSSDNCGIQSAALSQTDFSCEDIGVHTLQYTVEDASGNTAQTEFTVTVRDVTAPSVTLVQGHTIYLDQNGEAVVSADDMIQTQSDNCGIAMRTMDKTAFTCAEVGANAVTVLVEDNHGNNTFVSGEVWVADTLASSFTLSSIDLALDAEGVATLTADMLQPYAHDNCAIAEIAIQTQSFSCQDIGAETTTEIVVFDMNGNVSQHTLHVNLVDESVPEIEVEDITLVLNQNGVATLTVGALEYRQYDNCGIVSNQLTRTQFTCADLGLNTVRMTVEDASGNTANSNFTVTVVDESAPRLEFAPIVDICEGAFEAIPVTATDNCSATVTQTAGPQPGDILSEGTYTLEYTATDPSGNTAVATISLNVHPTPIVDLGDDIVVAPGETVTLSAGDHARLSYLWSTGDTTSSIQLTPDKNVTITVTVTSEFGCQSTDLIHVTMSGTTGVDEVDRDGSFTIYPNPATNAVSIAIAAPIAEAEVAVRIIDLTGQVVYVRDGVSTAADQVIKLDISDLSEGVYIVNIRSEHTNASRRLIKR